MEAFLADLSKVATSIIKIMVGFPLLIIAVAVGQVFWKKITNLTKGR